MSMFQMRKLRHQQGKLLAPGHMVGPWQSQSLKPGSMSSWAVLSPGVQARDRDFLSWWALVTILLSRTASSDPPWALPLLGFGLGLLVIVFPLLILLARRKAPEKKLFQVPGKSVYDDKVSSSGVKSFAFVFALSPYRQYQDLHSPRANTSAPS